VPADTKFPNARGFHGRSTSRSYRSSGVAGVHKRRTDKLA
jgi:hypothetical protein